jgi:hypothetical protein
MCILTPKTLNICGLILSFIGGVMLFIRFLGASHQGFRATYLAFVVRALVRSPWNRADYNWFPSPARR